MPFESDPYRTLGLAPGASLNEIRSAYRRLAKQYHPDAAGDRALPRFLAIQGAYERLVDGEGRLRRPGTASGGSAPGGRQPGGGPDATREPWRADPSRARASREAWRTRRGGRTGSKADDRDAGAGPDGGPRARPAPAPGGGPSGGPSGGRRAGGEHHRRPTRRATPGSTSYDEAAETPLDPAWDGGAWYGPSSGTYWTINPREYADPRKHGPEYLARARRAAGLEGEEDEDDDGEAGDGTGSPDRDPAWFGHAAPPPGPVGAPPPLPDPEALARRAGPRSLLALARRPQRRWVVLLALVGWPPLGTAIGALIAALTGCGRFAATCSEPLAILPLAIQPLIVAGLVLVPVAAAAAAFASLVALAVAVPVAAVLAVGTLPDSQAGVAVLRVVVAVAYLVALAVGIARVGRRPDGPAGP